MQQQDNQYTFVFVGIVAAIAALLLAMAFKGLEGRINKNIEIDKKRNILEALGIDDRSCKEGILKCYDKNIEGIVIDNDGNVQENAEAGKIILEEELKKPDKSKRLFPLFVKKDRSSDTVLNYCIPVQGKGLWSTIYGYLALENDLNTISGITFYKHGETPGLGAEIETAKFRSNFIGKKIFNDKNELVSITIVKGEVRADAPNKEHKVDGLSGATLTCNGVTEFLKKNLGLYESYFRMIRKESR